MRTRRRGDHDSREVIEISNSPSIDILQRLPRRRQRTVRYIESLDAFNHHPSEIPSSPETNTAKVYRRRRGRSREETISSDSDSPSPEEKEDDDVRSDNEQDDEEREELDGNNLETPSTERRSRSRQVLSASKGSGNSFSRRKIRSAAEPTEDEIRYSTRQRLRSSIEPDEAASPKLEHGTKSHRSHSLRKSILQLEDIENTKEIQSTDEERMPLRRRTRSTDDVEILSPGADDSNAADNSSRYTLRNRSNLSKNFRYQANDGSSKQNSDMSYDRNVSTQQAMDRASRYATRSKRDGHTSPKHETSKSYSLRDRNTIRRQRTYADEVPRPSSLYNETLTEAPQQKRSKRSARKYFDLSEAELSDGEMQMVKRSKKAKGPKAPPPADISPLDIDPSITWDSIGGLKSHIHALQEMVLLPLLYPEFYSKFSLAPPSGVLFYGPPGTGKTLVARALANSSGNQRITFYMRKGADCLSKWVGEAERQLRVLFEQAKKTEPSIIFFDEIDGLAPVRSAKQDQIHASIVSTLLALMDGLDRRGRVIVIGATNRIDSIDPALRRPGRFDRELAFSLPNTQDRASMLSIHTKHWNPPLSTSFKSQLADELVGYCGADIKALCAETALVAFKRTFPQVYDTPSKLEIDLNSISILRSDFQIAQAKTVPAAARSQAAVATPLPLLLKPLLEMALNTIAGFVKKSFPGGLFSTQLTLPTNTTPIYELPDTSCPGCHLLVAEDSKQCILCSKQYHESCLRPCGRCTSCLPTFTYLPPSLVRCLVYGESGELGQSTLVSALLCQMDGFPCYQFDRFSTPAQWMSRWSEVLNHVPCIVYCPYLDQMWTDYLHDIPPLLNHWMQTAQHLPIIFIATASTTNLHPSFLSLFPQMNRFEQYTPDSISRRAFWQVLQTWACSPPPIPPPPPKPLRIAPPLPSNEISKRITPTLDEQEQHQLRELRIFLEAVVAYCIRQKANAPFVIVADGRIDLNRIRDKVHDGEYTTWEKFIQDIHLIVQDAYSTYPKYSPSRFVAHAAANMQDNVMSFAHRFRKEQGYDLFAKCREIQQEKLARRPVPPLMELTRPGAYPPPIPPVVETTEAECSIDSDVQEVFECGDLVFVAKRTGPGMNKLGGAGRIQQTYTDEETGYVNLYDVKYILGGHEKDVDAKYVSRLTEDTIQNSVKMQATGSDVNTNISNSNDKFDTELWPHLYQAGWNFIHEHQLWIENCPDDAHLLTKVDLTENYRCFESRDSIIGFVKESPDYGRLCYGQRFVEMNIADGLLPKPVLWTPQEELYHMMLEDKVVDVEEKYPQTIPIPLIIDEDIIHDVINIAVSSTDGWTIDALRQEIVKFNHIILAHRHEYDRSSMLEALLNHVNTLKPNDVN